MNTGFLMGRLGQDPELKTGQSGTEYIDISLAVDKYAGKDAERGTEWIRCKAFGKTAVFIEKYFKKGDGLLVQYHLHTNTFEDKETGKKRTTTEPLIDRAYFPLGKGKAGSGTQTVASPEPGFVPMDDFDESSIPF